MAAAATVKEAPHGEADPLFQSVFLLGEHYAPTPQATPDIGTLSAPGQSFGGFNPPTHAVEEALQTHRAWSYATSWLKDCVGSSPPAVQPQHLQSFEYLLGHSSSAQILAEWYLTEITSRFKTLTPLYRKIFSAWRRPVLTDETRALVGKTLQMLVSAKVQCLKPLHSLDQIEWRGPVHEGLAEFRIILHRKWTTLVLNSLHRAEVQRALSFVFYHSLKASSDRSCDPSCFDAEYCHCPVDFDDVPLDILPKIGLGGDLAQHALGSAVHRFLSGPGVERRCFRVDWEHHFTCMDRLRVWTKDCFAPTIERANATLTGTPFIFSADYVCKLADIAVADLGRKRTADIFDLVKVWPHSAGAIEDIGQFLALETPDDKIFVCSTFDKQVQERLLHAGASTGEILGVYVNLINAFKALDARGVLLDKVTPSIRHYLRGRDDAVSIIAESFLADVDDAYEVAGAGHEKVCQAIVREVQYAMEAAPPDAASLGWNDMDWTPDPIDAGPNHRSHKSDDVLSYILGLFDQDDFIKEVTAVLAKHLLRTDDPEVIKETRLVELFKTRFDAAKLQAAEVMLKDIRDSVTFERRVAPRPSTSSTVPTAKEVQDAIPDEGITLAELYSRFETRMKRAHFQAAVRVVATRRNLVLYPKRVRLPAEPNDTAALRPGKQEPEVKLRILSSFFWPQMQTQKFALPAGLAPALRRTEDAFGRQSGQRKLDWRPALGRMSVTLELEDRTVAEADVPAWRAMVVDAFASQRGDGLDADYDDSAGRTVEQLVQRLEMDEELVREAVGYWSARRVLYQRSPGVYAVLERLDMEAAAAAATSGADARPLEQQAGGPAGPEAFSALKSQGAVLRESADMFETFIANMLRNGGPKEVGGMMGITNMMKMVLPAFTYGDDEVAWLLGQMLGRGEVARDGELWVIASR